MPIPVPQPVPEIISQPMPIPINVQPPLMNTCCVGCPNPCSFRRKRDTPGMSSNSTVLKEDPVCNNTLLKKIMAKKITPDPSSSQKLIAEEAKSYNVLCATGDLSYAAYTDDFCQITKDNVVCYAFKN
ncbi:unnamed protein product [Gongylonema pulchrum]|uniref:Ground-like domain-containing protein n=1 Tax=Gongylonema pulchrum TaxID=637853 RepID=A0A183DV22_9BILA|nr:unnamed protein product [Gongylonema pulchrum]